MQFVSFAQASTLSPPGGGQGRSRFSKEVGAARKCEKASAASRRLLPFVHRPGLDFWRVAHAKVGGHI